MTARITSNTGDVQFPEKSNRILNDLTTEIIGRCKRERRITRGERDPLPGGERPSAAKVDFKLRRDIEVQYGTRSEIDIGRIP